MFRNEKKTIKEWSLEKGIEIKNPTGFWGRNNQKYTRKYTERAFRSATKSSEIVCKTEKGMNFLEGKRECI